MMHYAPRSRHSGANTAHLLILLIYNPNYTLFFQEIQYPRRRRAAGVKIAGAGLTMLYFRSRVLYLIGKGEQKIPKASSLSKFQKYLTPTPRRAAGVLFKNTPPQACRKGWAAGVSYQVFSRYH